jgi:hypothetical protein
VNVVRWPEGTAPGFDFTDWVRSRRDGREHMDDGELAKLVEGLMATAEPWEPPAPEPVPAAPASPVEADAGSACGLPLIPELAWRHPFDIVRIVYTSVTEAPDAYFFGAFAAALGCLLSRNVSHYYAGRLPPNWYSALVGPTGDFKSIAIARAESICRAVDPTIEVLPGIGSGEILMDVLGRKQEGKPVLPRVLLRLDEFANVLVKGRQEYSTLVPLLTELYDGGDRVGLPTRGNPVIVGHPRLSIVALSTQEWIESKMREDDARGGFANRFVYWVGPLKDPLADPPRPDEGAEQLLMDEVRAALEYWNTQPGEVVLPRSSEAAEVWRQFYLGLRPRLETWHELTRALLQRIHQHVRKLAVLYAGLERKREITAEIMQAAVAMADYWIASARHVFRMFGLGKESRIEARVLEILRQRGGPMKVYQLHRAIGGRITSDRLSRLLDGMDRLDQICLDRNGKTVALNHHTEEVATW